MTAMIGADPELFLRDGRTGAVVPGVGLIGGSKDKPLPMKELAKGFALQEDNVMLEFNIPPASTAMQFSKFIQDALDYSGNFIRIKQEHLEFDVGHCSRMFSHEQLVSDQAKLFGCSADYNAHEQGRALPTPDPDALVVEDGAWRFAGGHVHFGYKSDVPHFVVGALADVYLGLPSVALDKQGIRRTLYGSAGRYRPTAHGLEYRTLSNFWIWDAHLREQIGFRALSLIDSLAGDQEALQKTFAEIPWPDVIDAINSEDEGKAADLITYLRADLRMSI